MFEGFDLSRVDAGEVTIRVRHGGKGPPLLLLHGNPQTHVMWHLIAPRLAKDFTVIAPDLRGYGESTKPKDRPDHSGYSKSAMARDQIAVMNHFGFDRFFVAGHDRGGRCAYRLALDHPQCVQKLAVLDIIPTGEVYGRMNKESGLAYWHFLWLAQPAPRPELMIENYPGGFFFAPVKSAFGEGGHSPFTREAYEEYSRYTAQKETIHAICEDYRAGATVDCAADETDRAAGRKIQCPLLVLWGKKAPLDRLYDVLDVWRAWAGNSIEGHALDCGHFLPEEAPEATYEALHAFFKRA